MAILLAILGVIVMCCLDLTENPFLRIAFGAIACSLFWLSFLAGLEWLWLFWLAVGTGILAIIE